MAAVLSCLLFCSLSAACLVDNPLFQLVGDSSSDPTGATTPTPTTSTSTDSSSAATSGEPPTGSGSASTDALTGGPTTTADSTTTTGTATTGPTDTTTGGMDTMDTDEPMKTLPACDASDPALIACYELDFAGDDPSAFLDSSQYGNHGQIVGPHVITGINGDALRIAPETELVVPMAASLNPTVALTMTAWVRLRESANKNRFVIHKQGQYDMMVTASGFLCHAGPYQLAPNIDINLPLNEWIHLACRYDNGFYGMFLNGDMVGFGQNVEAPIAAVDSPLKLGCAADCLDITHLDGDLDAVRIWTSPLAPGQIYAEAGK